MMRTPNLGKLTVLAAAVAAPYVASAQAGASAANTADAAQTLPAVMVTGEKIPRPLEESTSAVSVFTRRQLERSTLVDVTDLANRTPGLAVSFDNRDVAIRGVVREGFAAARDSLTSNFNDLIGVYLDGAPTNLRAGAVSLWDVEQIEVFRGAQTTNFGRNALAGVLNFRTADPVLRNAFSVRLGAGSRASDNASAMANLSLPFEGTALRVSVDKFRTDGSIANITAGVRADPVDRLTWRAKLLTKLGPDTRVVLGLSRVEVKQGAGLLVLDRFPTERVSTNDIPERTRKTSDAMTLRIEHVIDERWSLAATSAVTREVGLRTLDADASPQPLVSAQVNESLRDVSQEIKLLYTDPATQTRAAAGIYLRRYKQNAQDEASGAFSFINRTATRTRGQSLFGEFEWRFAPAWHATVGGRFDHESADTGIQTLGATALTATSKTNSEFLPKLSLAYDVSSSSRLSGTLQRAYRPGGSGVSLVSGQRYEYGAEFTDNVDLAYRSSWLDKALTFTAQAYSVNWKDQQVSVPTAAGNPLDSITVNAGRSRMQGLEFELAYRWAPAWSVQAAAAFQRNRFLAFADSGANYAGNRFPTAPASAVTLGVLHNASGGWYAGAEAALRSSAFSDAANTPSGRIGGYALVNLKGGWQGGPYRVSAFVRNALDRDVLYARFAASNTAAVAEPRTLGVEWVAQF